MSDEWGPWIEHDGRGCPLPDGTVAQAFFEENPGCVEGPFLGVVGSGGKQSWDWSLWQTVAPDGYLISRVIRYRIRKPRGMVVLDRLLADLPEKVDA